MSASLLGRGHNLPNAEFTAAALEQVENINLLDAERVEKETQIRLHAELDLSQIHLDLDAQILQSKEAASEKEWQIRLACDEKLEEIRREMSQRRQSIQNRLESILHGQCPDMSTETSTEHAETGVRTGIAVNENQSVAVDQRGVNAMGRANPTTASSTLANNVRSSSGIGAGNLPASNARLLTMEALQPGLSATQAFTHQGSSSGLGYNDDQSSTGLTSQLLPSNPSLPSSTSHQPISHVCCGCCGQDFSVWCVQCLGTHC